LIAGEVDFAVGCDRRDLHVFTEEPLLPSGFTGFQIEAGCHAIIADAEHVPFVNDRSGAIGCELAIGPEPIALAQVAVPTCPDRGHVPSILKTRSDHDDSAFAGCRTGDGPASRMRDFESAESPSFFAGG